MTVHCKQISRIIHSQTEKFERINKLFVSRSVLREKREKKSIEIPNSSLHLVQDSAIFSYIYFFFLSNNRIVSEFDSAGKIGCGSHQPLRRSKNQNYL